MFLLDVNVLIALIDLDHVHHEPAMQFFSATSGNGWATCAMTENGFLRIVGHSNYPKGPGSTDHARLLLQTFLIQRGHQFWSDSLSLCDVRLFRSLPPSKQLTDYYLLALAVKHHANMATFDRRIDPALLPNGLAAYHVIATA